MNLFFRFLVLFLFIFKAHAADLQQHISAIEMEASTASSLLKRSLNPHHQNDHRSDDVFEIRSPDSTHLGTYRKEGRRNYYVFNNIISTMPNKVVELSEDHKFTGCVRRDLHRLAKQIINSEIFRYENGKDYVFSGYGNGGSFAYLLAAEFYKRLPTEAQENQKRSNIVKVITFCPKPVGDAGFSSSFAETLAPVNALYFRPYFLFNVFDIGCDRYVPGVPLYITPFEWFMNNKLSFLSGAISCSSLLYLANKARIHGMPITMENSCNLLCYLAEKTFSLGTTIKENWYVSGTSTVAGFLSCLLSTPLSEDNVRTALRYTNEMYKTTDTPIYEAGKPGLLSVNRGFLRYMRSLF